MGANHSALAVHMVWHQGEVEKVLGEGAKFVTILRHPVDQFESMFSYYDLAKVFHMDIERFVEVYVDGGREVGWIPSQPQMPRFQGSLGRNQQLWDLGLRDTSQPAVVRARVEELDRAFRMVMVAERFDESLVLLGDLLCWPLANLTR